MSKKRRHKPYRDERTAGEPIGPAYKKLIQLSRDRMRRTDDDINIICFGPTGSGKSTLCMQTHRHAWNEKPINVSVYGFDAQSWAYALQTLKDSKEEDFICYDEANLSKRDSMTKKNKSFINLLFTIRSKNWCKWLNNPSGEVLDKILILDEVVNYFIYIYAKQARFYVFTRRGMQRLLEAHGNINGKTIREQGEKYAILDSYFTKYTGPEWEEYSIRKDDTSNMNLDEYIKDNIQGPTYTANKASEILGVSNKTVYRHLELLLEAGELTEEQVRAPTGVYKLSVPELNKLRASMGKPTKESNTIHTREQHNKKHTPKEEE